MYSGRSIWSLLVFGFAVPFFVWNCLMGFVIYVQHTHPRVAWYERRDEWSANAGYATTTVHVKLMRPLDGLIHYILEHGAHHVNMGIPLYRLKEAQARLSATLDERLNSEVFTWRYYWNTVRRCKLYDFAQHVWMDFDGHVTSFPAIGFALAQPPAGAPARRRASLLLQRGRMMAQVVRHEGLDEVIAVVVARLHPELELLARFRSRRGEFLGQQLLLQKLIRRALVDQDEPGKGLRATSSLASYSRQASVSFAEIVREAPSCPTGIASARRSARTRTPICTCEGLRSAHTQRPVAAHRMAEDPAGRPHSRASSSATTSGSSRVT